MHIIRETEKDTQKRVIEFFQDALNYIYLGNWADSADENSNTQRPSPIRYSENSGNFATKNGCLKSCTTSLYLMLA